MWIAEHIAMSLDSSCNAGLVPVLLVALSKSSIHNREVGVEAACTLQTLRTRGFAPDKVRD